MDPPASVLHHGNEFHVLQNLRYMSCGDASPLPQRFGELRHLQHLNLAFSVSLAELPDSFCQLTALHCLDLTHCQLRRLPPGFHKLSSLRYLQLCISGCAEPYSVLDSLSRLPVLEQLELDISNCSELVDIPADFLQARVRQTQPAFGIPPSSSCQCAALQPNRCRHAEGVPKRGLVETQRCTS